MMSDSMAQRTAEGQAAQAGRASALRMGIRIEVVTIVWMVVEAAVAIAAGIIARSLLLTAFGLDSVIELVSGAVLLWRLLVEARGGDQERVEWAERRAAWIVTLALALLAVYVFVSALHGLISGARPERSLAGIIIACAAAVAMPWLGVAKRRLATRLGSGALRGDADSSFTCGYMAATVLLGLALNALFGWWWIEDIAAFIFLFWLIGEIREAAEEAREAADAPSDD